MNAIVSRTLRRIPLIVVLFAHSALAQDAASKAREKKMNAVLSAQEGDKLMANPDRCRDAIAAYRVALEGVAIPPYALALAKALRQCGQLVESLAYAQHAQVMQRLHEPESADLSKAREDAKEFATELESQIPRLRVLVHRVPEGTTPSISIDGGKPAGPEAFRLGLLVNPGKHQVEVVAANFYDVRTVEAVPTKTTLLEVTLARTERSPLLLPALITGGAGLVVGSVAGTLSLIKAGNAKDHCVDDHCLASAQPDIDAANTLATVSNVGFVVAVAGAGVALWAVLTAKHPTEISVREEASWTPVVTGNGIALRRQF